MPCIPLVKENQQIKSLLFLFFLLLIRKVWNCLIFSRCETYRNIMSYIMCRSRKTNIQSKKTNMMVKHFQLPVEENQHPVKDSQLLVEENQVGRRFPTPGQVFPTYYQRFPTSGQRFPTSESYFSSNVDFFLKTFCRYEKSSYLWPRYKHFVKPLCMTRADCNPTDILDI